jgi:TIR domain
MTKEEIARDEANQFAFEKLESSASRYNGHKIFIEKIKDELQNFYDPEVKMLYLDQINLNIQHYKNEHKKNCVETDCDKDKTYEKMLFLIRQEINELPKIVRQSINELKENRTKVFISYSHKDKIFLDDFKRHFKPLEKILDFWDDSKIQVGQKWRDEISNAIQKAKIAILLISADFFNSDFIINNELPPLLQSAEKDGATIVTIILKPCLFEEYPEISQYQAINSPTKPISSLDLNAREFMWVETVRQIKTIISKED